MMHERALGVDLAPDIEAECIRDLSQHCSDMTAKAEVCLLPANVSFIAEICKIFAKSHLTLPGLYMLMYLITLPHDMLLVIQSGPT